MKSVALNAFPRNLGRRAGAKKLRSEGRRVGYSLSGEKLKKQMVQANDQAAGRVLFFGSDKGGEGRYEVKDLKTGEQSVCAFEEL